MAIKKCSELRTEIGIEISDVDLAIIAIRELDKIKLQQNSGYVYNDNVYSGKFKAVFRGRYIGDNSKQVSDNFIKDLVEKCTDLMDDETLNEENMKESAAVCNVSGVAAVQGGRGDTYVVFSVYVGGKDVSYVVKKDTL